MLYSLRHTVATQLKQQQTHDYLIAELLGHTDSSMSTGRYGKRVDVATLAQVVESLPFGEWLSPVKEVRVVARDAR